MLMLLLVQLPLQSTLKAHSAAHQVFGQALPKEQRQPPQRLMPSLRLP
jgi:hypothetical protein